MRASSRSLLAALVVLAAALAVFLAAGVARAQDPVAALPPGARLVVSARDGAAFWRRLRSTELWSSLATLRGGEADAGVEELVADAAWNVLVAGRAAIGFYGERADDRPDAVAVTEVLDPAAARLLLVALEDRLSRDRAVAFAPASERGFDLRVARDSAGREVLAWALERNRLFAGSSRARVAEAIERSAGGGAGAGMDADPRWLDAARRLDGSEILIWVDAGSLRETGPLRGPGGPVADWAAVGTRWAEGGLRADLYLALSREAPRALVSMASTPPASLRAPELLPRGTLLAFAIPAFDPAALLEAAESVADTAALQRSSARVEAWERESGIDLEADVVPAFGGELAFLVQGVDRTGFFPLPIVSVAVQVRDRERAASVLAKLESWSAESLRKSRSIPVVWQADSLGGTTVRYAPTPFGAALEPAYALHDGFLLLGSSRNAVRGVVDARAGRSQKLIESPELAALAGFLPARASGFAYLDLARIAGEAVQVARAFGKLNEETEARVAALMAAVDDAPRLGLYAEGEPEGGLWWRAFLEVR